MNESQALAAMAALSQQTRLRILRYLISKGPAGAPAGDVATSVDAAASRVSFHLSNLQNAGLITSERVSRSIIYRADFTVIGGLMAYLLKDCCQNHPDIVACCSAD